MTFPEILDAIDNLTDDQLAQVKQKIQHREGLADLSGFESLSNQALWTIIHEPFHLKSRLDELHNLRDNRLLTDEEEDEVDEILELSDRYILKRSMAMVTLQKRGVDVLTELSLV
jgi:hypothetical protein